MAIENSALKQEVQKIMTEGVKPVHFVWHAVVLANEEEIPALKVQAIDIQRNYNTTYADVVSCELIFGRGTYEHRVYPFKKDLKITLTRVPIGEVETGASAEAEREQQTFQAFLMDDDGKQISQNVEFLQDEEKANRLDLIVVPFQLVDNTVEQLRMESVGGVFRQTPTAEVLRFLLTHGSQQIDVDVEHAVQGVSITEPFNDEVVQQIVIPHGTKLVDVPEFLHEQVAGIYSTGLGYYLQKNSWYVFPLYDLTRFDSAEKTLTIINVPAHKLPDIERSYRTTADQLIILSTGRVSYRDMGDMLQMNDGNGVRFTDARRVMNQFVTTENNVTSAKRTENNSEFIAQERENKLNNVQLTRSRITGNTLRELSRTAVRNGCYIQATWDNSNPHLIEPGMPVKFLYLIEDQIQEAKGVILGAHHYIHMDRPGLTSQRHINTSALTMFVERTIKWDEVAEEDQPDKLPVPQPVN